MNQLGTLERNIKMNKEVESYIGELKELRELSNLIGDRKEFIEQRIQWLDSEIRMSTSSEWDKKLKTEMRDFLLKLLNDVSKWQQKTS